MDDPSTMSRTCLCRLAIVQEMIMVDTSREFVQKGGAATVYETKYRGVISSEDAGFYFIAASCLIFLLAALTGHLV
jgi:hypothetical protein